MKGRFLPAFRWLFILILGFSAWKIYDYTIGIQEKRIHNSEVDDVRNGILSADAWLDKILPIIQENVSEAELEDFADKLIEWIDEIYETSVQEHRRLDLLKILSEDNTVWDKLNNTFESSKNAIGITVTDLMLPQIKANIRKRIMENEDLIKSRINYETDSFLRENLKDEFTTQETEFLSYEQESRAKKFWIYFFLFVVVFYAIVKIIIKESTRGWIMDAIGLSAILLTIGLFCPMMEINVKLSPMQYDLLGSPISFEEQTLYFRSKSVLQVIDSLLYSNVFVAICILLFSIAFPITKLATSLLIVGNTKWSNDSRVKTITYEIGKWSMADVFIVAVFLATLGYDGLVRDQGLDSKATLLEAGFYFFLAYCLVSLGYSFVLKRMMRKELESTPELEDMKEQLKIQRKYASLGQLTASIAHEIKNPLNFVNNFSELNIELMEEMRSEVLKDPDITDADKLDIIDELIQQMKVNSKKINEHGKRADRIIHSMLLHSRENSGEKEEVNLVELVEDNLELTISAKKTSISLHVAKYYRPEDVRVSVIKQDMGRVIINLIRNSIYAMAKKAEQGLAGYEPLLTVSVSQDEKNAIIRIRDNGTGIKEEDIVKIWQPFYTTKPSGEGNTGLGLSICHDIVEKMHGGNMSVNSVYGDYTEFEISLPL